MLNKKLGIQTSQIEEAMVVVVMAVVGSGGGGVAGSREIFRERERAREKATHVIILFLNQIIKKLWKLAA